MNVQYLVEGVRKDVIKNSKIHHLLSPIILCSTFIQNQYFNKKLNTQAFLNKFQTLEF